MTWPGIESSKFTVECKTMKMGYEGPRCDTRPSISSFVERCHEGVANSIMCRYISSVSQSRCNYRSPRVWVLSCRRCISEDVGLLVHWCWRDRVIVCSYNILFYAEKSRINQSSISIKLSFCAVIPEVDRARKLNALDFSFQSRKR